MLFKNIQRFSNLYKKLSSQQCIQLEQDHGCHNYAPLNVVIDHASGIYVTDCEGKKYMDFLSCYSSVNQGHVHPKIKEAFIAQAGKVTLTSRAVYNSVLGQAEKYMTDLFKYQKILYMNTGVQAGQSAVKLARRWGYVSKKVQPNKATILFAKGNFWGRTIAACGSSDDPQRYRNFGPFDGLNFDLIDYGCLNSLQNALKANPNIVAYMVEPIQGEKGVIIPPKGYLKGAKKLLEKYNALLICDQIQTGIGRTGKLLASDHDDVRPDMILLGKALSGGFIPVSCVLADNFIMDTIKPGQHGSTYGGNPLGSAVSIAAVNVIIEENMIENSRVMGDAMLKSLQSIVGGQHIKQIRGRGLFIGVEFHDPKIASGWTKIMLKHGLIAKPTQKNIIRFSPPLIITKEQMDEALGVIDKSWKELFA